MHVQYDVGNREKKKEKEKKRRKEKKKKAPFPVCNKGRSLVINS